MKIILFMVGLYLGSGLVSNLLTALNNILMGTPWRQIDSTAVLHLALTILAFWMSFKFKSTGV